MPEPEREIEKQLKAYAEKRRQEADAPLELHPATRRMLQGEVSRRRATAAGGTNWLARLFAAYRSQMAVASGVVVALVLVAMVLVPQLKRANKETALTRLEEKDAMVKAKSEKAADQPAPASRAEFADADRRRRDEGAVFGSVRSGEATTVAVTGTGGEKFGDESRKRLNEPLAAAVAASADDKSAGGLQREVAALPAAPSPEEARATTGFPLAAVTNSTRVALALPPPTSATGSSLVADSPAPSDGKDLSKIAATDFLSHAVLTQNFTQTSNQKAFGAVAASSRLPNVLNSFRVERSGDKLQIIDSDGSTYVGYVEPAKEQEPPGKNSAGAPIKGDGATAIAGKLAVEESEDLGLARQNRIPGQQGLATETQNYFFRVAGTNRALQQAVVFTGNLISTTNAVAIAASEPPVEAAERLKNTNVKQFGSIQGQFENYHINGRVVVGKDQPLDIDAVAIPTP